MSFFSRIRRAVVKPFKQTSRAFKKARQQIVKAVPIVHKVGGFVRNPAKKVIPHSIRKQSWYKKFAAPVITYGITAAATAGVGAALGGTVKAVKIAKGISKGVTVASTFGKTRTTLRKIQGAKVQAKKIAVEQRQIAADSLQIVETQNKINVLKEAAKKRALVANGKSAATTQTKNKTNKPAFNTGAALVGAGAGALVAGPIGAVVGGAVGGLMKNSKDSKEA